MEEKKLGTAKAETAAAAYHIRPNLLFPRRANPKRNRSSLKKLPNFFAKKEKTVKKKKGPYFRTDLIRNVQIRIYFLKIHFTNRRRLDVVSNILQEQHYKRIQSSVRACVLACVLADLDWELSSFRVLIGDRSDRPRPESAKSCPSRIFEYNLLAIN